MSPVLACPILEALCGPQSVRGPASLHDPAVLGQVLVPLSISYPPQDQAQVADPASYLLNLTRSWPERGLLSLQPLQGQGHQGVPLSTEPASAAPPVSTDRLEGWPDIPAGVPCCAWRDTFIFLNGVVGVPESLCFVE